MFAITINLVYFISFIIIVQVEALDPLPVVEDNNIANTEAVIRNTVNSLFAPFKIKGIKRKSQIQQYSKIHNYFVSITLKDCENLKKIARLSAVHNIDNNTQNYITQINEVLNEGDKSDHVTTHIERFINKLRYLKEQYVSENDIDTNKTILKILEDNEKVFMNVALNKTVSNGIDDQSEDNNLLDNNEFWQSSGRRVFEGIRTKIKNFPFMASIHFFSQFQCAGCIIKNDLVITSASCLQIAWNNRFFRENPTFLAVRVGSNMYRIGGDYISVVEIFFHPQYSPNTLAHNLAIMRLGRVLKFRKNSKNLKKIQFDKSPYPLTSTTQITVVGWGARDNTNVINGNRLSYADLSFYPLAECQAHYSKVYVTNRNFCAGFFSKGGGACNHDAGGPGISDSKLVGVVSFGSPVCGASDAPTVFTKLGYYVDWIEGIIEQDTVTVKRGTTTWSPMPSNIPFRARLKETTKLLIQPMNFPAVRFEDVLRSRTSNETFTDDFVSTMFSSENDKNILYIDDSKEKNNIHTDQEKAMTTEKATAEWFIKTTTPVSVAPEPIAYSEDRRVPKLYMAVDGLTKPSAILSIEDQNQFNYNHMMGNKVSNEETITSQNSITTNSSKEEKSLIHDIMALIDNLDIDSLFDNKETHQNDNSEKNEISTTEFPHKLNSIALEGKVEKNPSESVVDSSVESSDDDYDDDYDNEDRGMAIQSGSFQDLTFREIGNGTKAENEARSETEISLF